jgi:uncharacterized protein YutE (UPF0331/DUF86 family)
MAEQGARAPDRGKIRQKIQFLRDAVEQLEKIRSQSPEEFLRDRITQAAATRYLQVGVEAILDTANHIVAREGLGIPKTYGETVELLVRAGILPREKAETYARMVKFRNRAVHLYHEIEPREIRTILDHHLVDFEDFIRAMTERYFR